MKEENTMSPEVYERRLSERRTGRASMAVLTGERIAELLEEDVTLVNIAKRFSRHPTTVRNMFAAWRDKQNFVHREKRDGVAFCGATSGKMIGLWGKAKWLKKPVDCPGCHAAGRRLGIVTR